jgi:ATP-dependent RNA helicase DDX1
LQDSPVQSALLVGGVKNTETIKLLDQNRVDVLCGTPPIVASYMKKGTIQASRCRFFVLDEADELISTDSVDSIRAIYGRLLASTGTNQSRFDRLQVCFFSATLHSKEVRDLAETLCHQPLWVDLRGQNDSILPDTVHHCVVEVSPSASPNLLEDDAVIETDAVHRNGKLSAKIELDKLNDKKAKDSECIKQYKPRVVLDVMERFAMEQVLIFCRTNLDCDLMEKFFKKAGGVSGMGISDKFSCRVLAGMRSMEERQQSLQAFKEGEVRILIATDVAARGIDINQLPFVINCTLPDKPEVYVHRCGRVGRAERIGLAISLVSTVKERVWFCKKGTKPPCADTRDFDKGGNCIWYDEPKYMSDIEKLLKQNKVSITKLQWPELKLPAEIQSVVQSGGYGETAGGGGTLDPAVKAKMDKIGSRVKQLELTESSLQTDYWTLRNKFRTVTSKEYP